MPRKRMDSTQKIVPHSDKKTGGLFDTDLASNKFHVAGDDSASDLLSAIDNGSDILTLDNFNPLFGEMDPFAEASLDSFVDLSEYLMEEPIPVAEVMPDTTSMEGSTSAAQKRKMEDTVDIGDCGETVVTYVSNASPDHEYSVKKPRLTSTSDVDDNLPSPVPGCSNETKYRMRREKNNVASKRSREIRKNKFSEMEGKANSLEVENEKMRGRIVELEALAKEMKAILVARLSGK